MLLIVALAPGWTGVGWMVKRLLLLGDERTVNVGHVGIDKTVCVVRFRRFCWGVHQAVQGFGISINGGVAHVLAVDDVTGSGYHVLMSKAGKS